MMEFLRLIRPFQWVKNLFVFLPMFFGGYLFDARMWGVSALAFVSFSLMASAIYCLNDILDVEADRKHPEKKNRPLARGSISQSWARSLFFILIAASESMAWLAFGTESLYVGSVVTIYLLLNIAYSYGLKRVAILDVMIIAIGFVLRLMAGGFACSISLSPWIVLMTFLLTLFMAFAKRRDDVLLRENSGIEIRKNIRSYNITYLNEILGLLACITLVCYIMYTVSPEVTARFHTDYVYVSSIFVLAGIIRYLQISIVDQKSGNPTKILLRDTFIQVCCVCWAIFFLIIIYIR